MAKVLLVEDDNNLREIFEMRLQAEGYQTLAARDGEEALVVAMKEKPDLIIADVMMPRLSGFEMLETLRAAPEMDKAKVILMTALGQAEDRARGEKLGVVKYLVKSQVTLEDFVRVVREVLGAGAPAGSKPPPSSGATQSTPLAINKESEKSMQDDTQSTNPSGPSSGGGDSAPGSDPTSGGGMGPGGQMSSSDEQGAVQNQINSFVSGGPGASSPASSGMPGGNGGGSMPSDKPGDDMPPVSTPPPGPGEPPAAPEPPASPPEGPTPPSGPPSGM